MFTGDTVKRYLARVISELDAGQAPHRKRRGMSGWVRVLAVPAALGVSTLGLQACNDDPPPPQVDKSDADQAKADGDTEWICELLSAEPGCDFCDLLGWYDDGVCDDFCDQSDPDCSVPPYSIPFEEVCDDEIDNDGDGRVDCDDADCEGSALCGVLPPYSIPFEDDCDDGIDNDYDGLVDCDDPECAEECAPPPG